LRRRTLLHCDLIPCPLLLKEKGDEVGGFCLETPLSFRRGVGGEVAGGSIAAVGKIFGGSL
jgi:hypothetical protein